MSYIVLARKWRPRNFTEVAGQEHIVQTLSNAIELNRLHHAYLFTGTRGVGKTTIARILARCLNCEKGPTTTPCGECEPCVKINDGRFVDLIEVDAASRTGVDNMRELLDNVQYAPSMGRYKIYLIDEVHMLSTSSFNALLKTLEEPPPHITFLFATTNPQKIPMTILSRCLKLNLMRIPDETIDTYLKDILNNEDIKYEEKALNEIIIGAQGSMRDALSLLDQAIAYGNGQLESQAVNHMLGLHSREYLIDIFQCIANNDAKQLVKILDTLYQNAVDFSTVLNDFINMLHQIAMCQALPDATISPRFDAQSIQQFANSISAEDIQLAYQFALIGKRDMPLVGDDKSAIEMTMLRILNFIPLQSTDIPTNNVQPQTQPSSTQPSITTAKNPPAQPSQTSSNDKIRSLKEIITVDQWENFIQQLDAPPPIKNICLNSVPEITSPNSIILKMDESTAGLCNADKQETIKNILQQITHQPNIKVELKIASSADIKEAPAQIKINKDLEQNKQMNDAVSNDSDVELIKQEFDASIISTEPLHKDDS